MDVIKVEKRNGKAKAKHLRRSGLVPCCVYGGGLAGPISIQMDLQTANQLFRTKREGRKVGLDLNGRVIPTQIKEKKRDALSNEVEHFSFQALTADQKVNSIAHIFLKNADAVPGILEQGDSTVLRIHDKKRAPVPTAVPAIARKDRFERRLSERGGRG